MALCPRILRPREALFALNVLVQNSETNEYTCFFVDSENTVDKVEHSKQMGILKKFGLTIISKYCMESESLS